MFNTFVLSMSKQTILANAVVYNVLTKLFDHLAQIQDDTVLPVVDTNDLSTDVFHISNDSTIDRSKQNYRYIIYNGRY